MRLGGGETGVQKSGGNWETTDGRGWIRLCAEDGMFGVGEFFVAAVVAAGVDQFLGGGEIGLRTNPLLGMFLWLPFLQRFGSHDLYGFELLEYRIKRQAGDEAGCHGCH